MKRTRVLSIILAIAMMLSLCACSGSAAPAPSGSTAAPSGSSENPSVEPLEILFSATVNQNETLGQVLQHFAAKLEELSGGAITAKITWGGTLFDSAAELDAIKSGSCDMVALGHMPHLETLTYLSFPGFAPGDTQTAVDYFNYLIFENEETAQLIQQEAADNGIKYLNVIANGANAFCAKFAFSDLDSLIAGSAAFGNFDAAIYQSLGFQVTPIIPPEIYDSLNRGLCDATQCSLSAMVMLSWDEVASYWALDGTYSAGYMFTVNQDWWNGLSAEQQAIIQQAADSAEEFSIGQTGSAIDADIAAVEASTGNPFVTFSDSDYGRIWEACFEAKAESALNLARNAGKLDGMVTILNAAAEFTNYSWTYEG